MKQILIGLFLMTIALFSFSMHRLSQEKRAVILSIPKNHMASLHDTEDTFQLEFLVDGQHSFMFEKNMIDHITIRGNQTATDLILASEPAVIFREDIGDFYQVRLNLRPEGFAAETILLFEDATLEITTIFGTVAHVPIGHLTLHCGMQSDSSLDYRRIDNIPGDNGYGVTAMAVVIELFNPQDDSITIEKIHFGSDAVIIDHERIRFHVPPYEPFMTLKMYENAGKAFHNGFVIEPGDTKRFMMPFTYVDTTLLYYRYPLIIETDDGTRFIDTFPFINTDLFHEDNRSLFQEGSLLDND